jgi:hypothetical protein
MGKQGRHKPAGFRECCKPETSTLKERERNRARAPIESVREVPRNSSLSVNPFPHQCQSIHTETDSFFKFVDTKVELQETQQKKKNLGTMTQTKEKIFHIFALKK